MRVKVQQTPTAQRLIDAAKELIDAAFDELPEILKEEKDRIRGATSVAVQALINAMADHAPEDDDASPSLQGVGLALGSVFFEQRSAVSALSIVSHVIEGVGSITAALSEGEKNGTNN